MTELRLAAPWLLALLPLAAGAAWWFGRRRRRGDARLQLPAATDLLRLGRSPWQMVEHVLPWLRGLALVLVVGALGRPQAGERLITITSYGVDVVVALDISRSMSAEDFHPDNRLTVARETVERFIEGRPNDRIGLVVFAELAVTRCPVTTDHSMLLQFLDEVDFAPPEQGGTALGMGLATAVNRLRRSDAEGRVVVLVTDGRNNSGQIGPAAAAAAAKALGVRVYTVGVGSEGEAPVPMGPGLPRRMQRLDLDESLLKEIASETGGQYFRALDAEGLADVFERIDELEPTKVESQERVLHSEMFHWLLLPALGMLLLERILVGTRLRRIP